MGSGEYQEVGGFWVGADVGPMVGGVVGAAVRGGVGGW